jgi:hypothetical protein
MTSESIQSRSDYITHTFIGDQRIIPFNTFDIKDNHYTLLKIIESTDSIIFLKLIVIKGPDFGKRYLIPKREFEVSTLEQIQTSLSDYQIN